MQVKIRLNLIKIFFISTGGKICFQHIGRTFLVFINRWIMFVFTLQKVVYSFSLKLFQECVVTSSAITTQIPAINVSYFREISMEASSKDVENSDKINDHNKGSSVVSVDDKNLKSEDPNTKKSASETKETQTTKR